MQNHSSSGEFSVALTLIGLGFARLVDWLVSNESVLASISYIVAIIAGLLTIYFKLKRKE